MARIVVNASMRRSTIRFIGASLLTIPLVSTCSLPKTMVASAHEQVQPGSEDRLIDFLIDGDRPAAIPAGG
jgi:hypothetical protein